MTLAYGKIFEDWNDVMRELHGGSFGFSISDYPHSIESQEAYTVQLPLVGISREELNIDMELIRGVKYINIKAEPKVKSKLVQPRTMSYQLRDDADMQNVDAKLENGLLTIKIPKIKPEKKTVSIKVN